MKRIGLLSFLLVIFLVNANSQSRIGIKGGLNTAYFNSKEVRTGDFVLTTLNDASVGFHGGVLLQLNFFRMFIQPELLFSSIGSEVKVSDLRGEGTIDLIREQNYSKLDFPVLIGRRFGAARIGIGPVGTIMISTKSELNEFGFEEQFNSATFGYQIGAGLDILKRLALDLRYEGSLSRLGTGITVAGQEREFDSRSRQLIVSLGIYL